MRALRLRHRWASFVVSGSQRQARHALRQPSNAPTVVYSHSADSTACPLALIRNHKKSPAALNGSHQVHCIQADEESATCGPHFGRRTPKVDLSNAHEIRSVNTGDQQFWDPDYSSALAWDIGLISTAKDTMRPAHSLVLKMLPPSSVMVAPLTNEPALLDKYKQVPATSSGAPIRCNGIPSLMLSSNLSSVAAIIFDRKGPQAIVFDVIFRSPRCDANTRDMWCKAAFDAEYANVSSRGTRSPSMLPMLITRAGSPSLWALSINGVSSCVMVKTLFKLSVITRSHALSDCVSGESAIQCVRVLTRIFSIWSRPIRATVIHQHMQFGLALCYLRCQLLAVVLFVKVGWN